MKQYRLLFCTIFFLFAVNVVSAQNWLDALKKVASEAVDEATGGKLTELAIIGTWEYAKPAIRMSSSDNMLATMGASAISSTVENKLESAYKMAGIKKGACKIVFGADGTFSMTIGARTLTGTYTYNNDTHAVTMTFAKSLLNMGSFKGYAYISGTDLQLVFSVEKLTSFVTKLGTKVSALSSVTSMLKQFDNTYIGFGFAK